MVDLIGDDGSASVGDGRVPEGVVGVKITAEDAGVGVVENGCEVWLEVVGKRGLRWDVDVDDGDVFFVKVDGGGL